MFVNPDGTDKAQVLFQKTMFPRANVHLAEWHDTAPGGAWEVASFDPVDVEDYCEVANKRWAETARQVAAA